VIRAYFGIGSPHPHLQGVTVGDWPLNVFDEHQAAGELATLRTIAGAEIHNLVDLELKIPEARHDPNPAPKRNTRLRCFDRGARLVIRTG
jgi:hypothetical protein